MAVHATLQLHTEVSGSAWIWIGNPELLQFMAPYEYGRATWHQLHIM